MYLKKLGFPNAMRPVLHSDVVAAARVLLALPKGGRLQAMRKMLERAGAADLYRKRLRKHHPDWGNGSLMAVAMGHEMRPEPFMDDPDYCRCLMVVFEGLLNWRCEKAAHNQTRRLCRLGQLKAFSRNI